MRVDGVQVFGRIQDLSVAEIRHAIADLIKRSPLDPKPRALEVISKREMRAYSRERDMGWVPVRLRLTTEPDGRKHPEWWAEVLSIELMPEVFQLIRSAEQVYIFPVKNSLEPRRDEKDLRLLEQKTAKELIHLLGHRSDWDPDQYSLIVEPRPDVGFVFRHGRDEVVLFFCATATEGTINGQNTKGLLDRKRHEQFEEWKRRYAQRELPPQ